MSAPPWPSGSAPSRATPWRLLTLTGALLVVRLCLGGLLPLTEDEAYYRLWAQAPALGYYDHPPMIAWWIWLGVHLLGDTPLAVRLLPSLAVGALALLAFDMARLAGANPATAERAGLWFNLTLLAAAGGFLAVPDAPAALFWSLSLWSVLRARRVEDPAAIAWWLAAGVAAGLATLSKYSALFLGPGVLIWLLASPVGRASLRAPGPWLALLVAAALFGLNIEWNATHHWLTFLKQFGRVAPHRWAPAYLAEFVLTEFLLLNPLVAIFLIRWPRSQGVWPFLLTSAPFLAYLVMHSLHDRIQAHWPAPVFPALAICAAFNAEQIGGVWSPVRRAAAPFALAVCTLGGLYASLPLLGARLRFDPALPLRGWPAFAQAVESRRVAAGAAWVGVTSYGLAAQLSDQPGIAAPVVQISERARWPDLPAGRGADVTRPGLIVDLTRRIDPTILRACFRTVIPITILERGPPGARTRSYGLYEVDGPRGDLLGRGCGPASSD